MTANRPLGSGSIATRIARRPADLGTRLGRMESRTAADDPIADINGLAHHEEMTEQETHLGRMSSAEGSAAAEGLAILLEHLLDKGVVDEALVSNIRDAMLLALDPSVTAADDRGLQLAYVNTLVRYRFLSTEPRDLFEPEWEGGIAVKAVMSERNVGGSRD